MSAKPLSYDPEKDTPEPVNDAHKAAQARIAGYRKLRGIGDDSVKIRLTKRADSVWRDSFFFAIERGDLLLTNERAQIVARTLGISLKTLDEVMEDSATQAFKSNLSEPVAGYSQRDTFGAALREARVRKGMSQTALAKAAHTFQATISDLETREGVPHLKTLRRLASGLGVDWKAIVPYHLGRRVRIAMELEDNADQKLLDDLADVL